MTDVFCADCGTECRLVDGRDVDQRDPEIADVRVWACPECPAAWAHHAPRTGAPAAAPAGLETRNARELLAERMIYPLIHEATGGQENLQPLAIDRLTGFLADRMSIEPEACEVARFDLEQCRAAWKALRGVTFDDVRQWAQRHRRTRKPEQPTEGVRA